MITGQPGSGKSLFSLDYAVKSGVTALYFSADSDEDTVINRIGAMQLGRTTDNIESLRESPAADMLEEVLADLSRCRLVFDTMPTLGTIEDELMAWEEMYGPGEAPDLLVVDNLMNVVCETTGDEWQGYKHIMAALHEMARATGTAVIILHHTTEGEGNPLEPQSRKAVMGKVNQLPEVILTVAHDPNLGTFGIGVVKNRNGRADPTAQNPVTLRVDLPKMTLSELDRGQYVNSPQARSAIDKHWDMINGQGVSA